jgi:hypothetical protein
VLATQHPASLRAPKAPLGAAERPSLAGRRRTARRRGGSVFCDPKRCWMLHREGRRTRDQTGVEHRLTDATIARSRAAQRAR